MRSSWEVKALLIPSAAVAVALIADAVWSEWDSCRTQPPARAADRCRDPAREKKKKLQRGEDSFWCGCLSPSTFYRCGQTAGGSTEEDQNLWRLLSNEVVCVLREKYETFLRWLITTCECNQRSDIQMTAEEQMIQSTGFMIKASDKSSCPKHKEARRDIWMLQNEKKQAAVIPDENICRNLMEVYQSKAEQRWAKQSLLARVPKLQPKNVCMSLFVYFFFLLLQASV